MTDTGLNQRLRQRSRRSGLMIGFSMALTLAVCVASFTFIFARLEPLVADFVGQGDVEIPTAVPTAVPPTAVPVAANTDTTTGETPSPTETPTDEAAADADAFVPDYQVSNDGPVNLRPGPGVASGDPIVALPPNAPLMYLDAEEATTDPDTDQMDSGQVWMQFSTEDGEEGWVREIDVSTYEPS
jgi:hypothetical protein